MIVAAGRRRVAARQQTAGKPRVGAERPGGRPGGPGCQGRTQEGVDQGVSVDIIGIPIGADQTPISHGGLNVFLGTRQDVVAEDRTGLSVKGFHAPTTHRFPPGAEHKQKIVGGKVVDPRTQELPAVGKSVWVAIVLAEVEVAYPRPAIAATCTGGDFFQVGRHSIRRQDLHPKRQRSGVDRAAHGQVGQPELSAVVTQLGSVDHLGGGKRRRQRGDKALGGGPRDPGRAEGRGGAKVQLRRALPLHPQPLQAVADLGQNLPDRSRQPLDVGAVAIAIVVAYQHRHPRLEVLHPAGVYTRDARAKEIAGEVADIKGTVLVVGNNEPLLPLRIFTQELVGHLSESLTHGRRLQRFFSGSAGG